MDKFEKFGFTAKTISGGTHEDAVRHVLANGARDQIAFALLDMAVRYVAAYVRAHPLPEGIDDGRKKWLIEKMATLALYESLKQGGQDMADALEEAAGEDAEGAEGTTEQQEAAKEAAEDAIRAAMRGNSTKH